MRRLLLDYTDIEKFDIKEVDDGMGTITYQVVITIKGLDFFDIANKTDVKLLNHGIELAQYADYTATQTAGVSVDAYYFDDRNRLVILGGTDESTDFCAVKKIVTGLELIYPMKEIKYTTEIDNATYDLKVKLSSTGELIHVGDNMSFSDIQNVIRVLNNKMNVNSFGYDIFEINRSLDEK